MFPVHGWTVPKEVSVHAKSSGGLSNGDGALEPASQKRRPSSKKRKRDAHALQGRSRVTGDDLQTLWNAQFGDGTSIRQEKSSSSSKRILQKLSGSKTLLGGPGDVTPREKTSKNYHSDGEPEPENSRKAEWKGEGASKKSKEGKQGTISQDDHVNSLPQHSKAQETRLRLLDAMPKKGKAKPRSKSIGQTGTRSHAIESPSKVLSAPPKLTPLQARMRGKLTSARFRHLNELLYTSPSSTSLDLFTSSPDLFTEYHQGFSQQVKDSWPENPVDGYVREIKIRAKKDFKMGKQNSNNDILPLPRRKTGRCTMVDLGCGDAPLARTLVSESRSLNLNFHNYDLYSPNSLVTIADIARLPLRDGEADVAIFCLSLMGTNWLNFVEEAWRVLRGDGKGELWIAEVKSRFGRPVPKVEGRSGGGTGKRRKPISNDRSEDHTNENVAVLSDDDDAKKLSRVETDVSAFVSVVQRRGFVLRANSVNKHNKMFVNMIFTKSDIPSTGKHEGLKWDGYEYRRTIAAKSRGRKKFIDSRYDQVDIAPEEEAKVLKPCVYKKR